MDKIIELKNVSFRYSDEETEVIKNLNLDFYEGQFTCVLGHNGSGKSTMAKLINALLVLMGKSLNTQAVFGRGLDTSGQTAKEAYVTGTLNDKGLFWGDSANGTSAVKVFGMENWWACCWRRTAGCISVNRALKLKLTYGTADGSTVVGYNQTGNGYISNGTIPSTNNYVVELPLGTTEAPVVEYTTAYPEHHDIVVENKGLDGGVVIKVTPKGTTNTRTYKIT